jgi:hypothetical protein
MDEWAGGFQWRRGVQDEWADIYGGCSFRIVWETKLPLWICRRHKQYAPMEFQNARASVAKIRKPRAITSCVDDNLKVSTSTGSVLNSTCTYRTLNPEGFRVPFTRHNSDQSANCNM